MWNRWQRHESADHDGDAIRNAALAVEQAVHECRIAFCLWNELARGEKGVAPIETPMTQELALLSQNITAMAETIVQRSEYIRSFAMHVSHEFKTPLTAIQGAIELIGEHGHSMPVDQFEKFLSNVTKDIGHLKNLVSRLLELARADVMQPTADSCDFSKLMEELQSDFRDKSVRLTADISPSFTLPLPEDIARVVFQNLIANSMQHGASCVEIVALPMLRGMRIRVQDDGRGISPANAGKLFTPFFTTRREQGGTGLGLVILRSLLQAHRASIHHEATEKGACFVINFGEGSATDSL